MEADKQGDRVLDRYRMYFNRIEDQPQIWSVDEGSHASEINVRELRIDVPIYSESNLDAQYPEPKAWMVAHGVLKVIHGCAYIR